MKFYKKILVLGSVSILSLSSCSDFLEVEPADFSIASTFYQDQGQVNQALAAIYSNLRNADLAERYYTQGVVQSDEGYYGINPTLEGPAMFNNRADLGIYNGFWVSAYQGINQANTLIDNIGRSNGISQEIKSRAIGEALFLRGYFHFMLTNMFGAVPLKLSATTDEAQGNISRTPQREVYDQVIADMTRAEELLQGQTIASLGHPERISKTAVQGILARVNLYAAGDPVKDTKRFANALDWAKKVVNSGEHALNPDFKQIFINHSQDLFDIKESMWELGYRIESRTSANNVNSWVQNFIGVRQVGQQPATLLDSGYVEGVISVHPRLFLAYGEGDVRRNWTIANYIFASGITANTINRVRIPSSQVWDRFPGKWRRDYESADSRGSFRSGTTNYPVLRYSDVLLMLAEAENEVNGPTPVAYDAINRVRRRAFGITNGNVVKSIRITNGGTGYTSAPTVTISGGGGNGATATAIVENGIVTDIYINNAVGNYAAGPFYTSAPTITISGGGGTGATATATITKTGDADLTPGLSKEQFRQAVRDERFRELAFEGVRQNDLKRWGILISTIRGLANDVNGNTPGIPIAPATRSGYESAIVPTLNIDQNDLLWPIPLRELLLNPLLNPQNPGY